MKHFDRGQIDKTLEGFELIPGSKLQVLNTAIARASEVPAILKLFLTLLHSHHKVNVANSDLLKLINILNGLDKDD